MAPCRQSTFRLPSPLSSRVRPPAERPHRAAPILAAAERGFFRESVYGPSLQTGNCSEPEACRHLDGSASRSAMRGFTAVPPTERPYRNRAGKPELQPGSDEGWGARRGSRTPGRGSARPSIAGRRLRDPPSAPRGSGRTEPRRGASRSPHRLGRTAAPGRRNAPPG